jgi:flagellar hook protein FlgE
MSLHGALLSGVSGLRAQSQSLGTISDNISNVNTIGYKRSVAQFSTLVTGTSNTSTYFPGGVRARATSAAP